jgi:hypothetical protein
MKRIILLLLLAAVTACNGSRKLQTGDLIFVGIPQDYSLDGSSMDSAISQATGNGELNLIHVAIAEVERDSVWIIDATIAHGVDRHPLDTFLRDFTLRDGSLPVFEVKRLRHPRKAALYVEQAKAFIGQEYDMYFLPDNGRMYCSELVQQSYRDGGTSLFESGPMNFLNASGEMPLYWEQLFSRLGQEVPQGVPGTNPQDMSAAPVLRSVPVTIP